MREINKYTIMNIYLQPSNATLHIKSNIVVIKCNESMAIVTHVKILW
jgi:hypothetical protein